MIVDGEGAKVVCEVVGGGEKDGEMCLERGDDLCEVEDLLANVGRVVWGVKCGHEVIGRGEEEIGLREKGVERGHRGRGGVSEEIEQDTLVEEGGEAQELVDLKEH